jgi:rod shape-determining protein MreD
MKRLAGYVALILVLVAVEATVPALPWLHTFRPLLHLPLVIFFALRLSTIEGALLSFLAGSIVDVTVPYGFGLAAFTDLAIFVLTRVTFGGIRADGWFVEAFFAFLLAAVFHAMTWGLRRLLGAPMTTIAGTPWLPAHVIACASTAVMAPFVFRAARRVELLKPKQPGMLS